MNIWGWLVVLGAVGAAVGFVLYGMGTSTLLPDEQLISSGRYLDDRWSHRARCRLCRVQGY